MNKRFRFCSSLVLAVAVMVIVGLIAHPADAAQQKAGGANAEEISWNGLYAGIHVGYGWGDADTRLTSVPVTGGNDISTALGLDPGGVFGGAQIGYNLQKKWLVIGIETDFSGSDISGTTARSPFVLTSGVLWNGALTAHQDTDWLGTLRLRLGIAPIQRLLVYVTGGMAYGHVNYSANADGRPQGTIYYPTSFNETKVGWTAGAGAEFALSKRWSIKAEYLYYDLGSESKIANPVPPNPPFQLNCKWDTSANTVQVGLNFHF